MTVQPAYHAGNIRPVQFFGIMSSILLSSALLYVPSPFPLPFSPVPPSRPLKQTSRSNKHSPQYYEIYKYREVIGISVVFMAVDLMGGVFSLLSLAFKEHFDVIAAVAYGAVVVSYLFPNPPSTDLHLVAPGCFDCRR